MRKNIDISILTGKTITKIDGMSKDSEMVTIYTSDGKIYQMYMEEEYGADIYLEDVCGDILDLIGYPILKSEKETNKENSEDGQIMKDLSFTWTFYKLSTIKGDVTLRWYGASEGYYSEEVDFYEVITE